MCTPPPLGELDARRAYCSHPLLNLEAIRQRRAALAALDLPSAFATVDLTADVDVPAGDEGVDDDESAGVEMTSRPSTPVAPAPALAPAPTSAPARAPSSTLAITAAVSAGSTAAAAIPPATGAPAVTPSASALHVSLGGFVARAVGADVLRVHCLAALPAPAPLPPVGMLPPGDSLSRASTAAALRGGLCWVSRDPRGLLSSGAPTTLACQSPYDRIGLAWRHPLLGFAATPPGGEEITSDPEACENGGDNHGGEDAPAPAGDAAFPLFPTSHASLECTLPPLSQAAICLTVAARRCLPSLPPTTAASDALVQEPPENAAVPAGSSLASSPSPAVAPPGTSSFAAAAPSLPPPPPPTSQTSASSLPRQPTPVPTPTSSSGPPVTGGRAKRGFSYPVERWLPTVRAQVVLPAWAGHAPGCRTGCWSAVPGQQQDEHTAMTAAAEQVWDAHCRTDTC